MSPDASPLDGRRKRILYRACHRGTREMDLVMGRFARREIATMQVSELDLFERLLDEPEPDVFDWIMERSPAPPAYDGPLLARLRDHQP